MAYIGQDLSQGKATRVTYTASGGETSITQSYTPGQTDVYLNGVKLVEAVDYAATNGSTISAFSPALVSGDVVDIVSLNVFSATDTVSAASGGTFAGRVTHQSVTDNPTTLNNDITAPVNYSTAITGPVTIDADLIVNGNVTVLTELNVTGNVTMATTGSLNIIG